MKPGARSALLVLLALPLGLLLWRQASVVLDRRRAETLALAELASPAPRREAWGVLGAIRLEQGRLAEALPLLQKAADLEAEAGSGVGDSLALAQALIRASAAGMAQASPQSAGEALRRAEGLAGALPRGRQAAALFDAGRLWADLGRRDEARRLLAQAVALQPDDWVDEGGGVRYKSKGISAYYQKTLAAALQER